MSKKPIALLTTKTYKIWCDECYAWVDDFELSEEGNYICCSACANGLVMII